MTRNAPLHEKKYLLKREVKRPRRCAECNKPLREWTEGLFCSSCWVKERNKSDKYKADQRYYRRKRNEIHNKQSVEIGSSGVKESD